ncbi:MAG: response regulator transcription factor [Gammaproteobacteria bacterium]|jgi:FixJ family two-component response regulator|nr:DNA-binding response regulator [Chromatiales bacterium]MDP6413563.1 response regulator transcription factor [Gammaproteobacteria bacterium]MDP6675361.1 response regulator transcription factor [Gammaproteobacteria bacterium]
MTDQNEIVFIVDDDVAVRDSLGFLLKSVDIESQIFTSGDEFLAAYQPEWEGCILLDIRMPGISGMEVQRRLTEEDCSLPIIFITGHGDISMAVEAMHLGAHDFVQKPFHDQDLLDKIQTALALRRETQDEVEQKRIIQQNYSTLTPRETEVMSAVAKGHANKVIAMDLDLSQRTVEIHRARVMEKMQVRSLADLVKLAVRLEE